jgi:hypothetical protein
VPPPSTTFDSTRADHDDLRSVSLLTEDCDLRPRLAALHATAVMIPRLVKGSLGHSTLVNFTSSRPPRQKPRPKCRIRRSVTHESVMRPPITVSPRPGPFRGGLVVVIVSALVEELVTHLVGECLAEFDRQRLPGGLAPLPRAFLARWVAQGDLAAGLLGQEALVMEAARDQGPSSSRTPISCATTSRSRLR